MKAIKTSPAATPSIRKSVQPQRWKVWISFCLAHPFIIYAAVAFTIFLPLLTRGYILTLDMVFTPWVTLPAISDSHFVWLSLLRGLNLALPMDVVQKIILLGTFTLAGYSAHIFIRYILTAEDSAKNVLWASYFAGLLYTCNPFTYTRLMAGHYVLLIGYAILPLLLYAFWKFCERPGPRTILPPTVLLTLITLISLHAAVIAALACCFMLALWIWRKRTDRKSLKGYVGFGILGVAIICVLNSFWLLPFTTGRGDLAMTAYNLVAADQKAFTTSGGEWGVLPNILALQGFWGDDKNLYFLPADIIAWWPVPIALLWVLIILGVCHAWKQQRGICMLFISLILIMLALASGITSTIFAQLNVFLFERLPLFNSFREPQKFTMLIVVGYIYFGAHGILWLRSRQKLSIPIRDGLCVAACLIPLGIAPLLPWGASGQLRSKNYPTDWHRVRETLRMEAAGSRTLFLPWHLYMPYRFSNGVIANPAPKFFSVPIISSIDPEMSGATGYANSDTRRQLQNLLDPNSSHADLASQLSGLTIRYIILAKEFDYQRYSYLDGLTGVEKYITSDTIDVYRIGK